MKKIIAATTVALALATTASAELQVGLGYTISDGLGTNATTPANIRVPLDFDFGLRIEPELGFGTSSDNAKDTTTFALAVGGYYNLWAVEKVNFYAGGRLAYTSVSNDSNIAGVNLSDTSNTSIQALFGAEYMFTEKFSFGAQAGLENISGDGTTGFGTVSHLLVHYFF